jgi:hypothetical protein
LHRFCALHKTQALMQSKKAGIRPEGCSLGDRNHLRILTKSCIAACSQHGTHLAVSGPTDVARS